MQKMLLFLHIDCAANRTGEPLMKIDLQFGTMALKYKNPNAGKNCAEPWADKKLIKTPPVLCNDQRLVQPFKGLPRTAWLLMRLL